MHTSRIAHEIGSGGEHPSVETLAAFLDARLPRAERAEVMAHLAACSDCFKLFADTARTLRELEKVAPLPFEWRGVVRHALPWAAAAVLVLAAGLAAYRWLWWTVPRMENAALVEPLRSLPGLREEIGKGWDTYRGEELPSLVPSAEAFLLGARLLEFQLSVEARYRDQVSDAARGIANVLEQEGSLYSGGVEDFRAVPVALEQRVPTSRFRNLAERTEREELAGGFSRLYLDFGKWTAAGRLSAIAGSKAFFERRSNRRFLELLLEDPARLEDGELVPLPREVRDELERVRGTWDAGRFATKDYEAIKNSLEAILKHFERMSDPLDFE